MYKFYAVQRWSSYAYSAVNLKVGGVYLIVLLFTRNCSFCRRNFLCVMWRHFSVNTVRKNVFHVHGYYHFHYAGLPCTIIKKSVWNLLRKKKKQKRTAWCFWVSGAESKHLINRHEGKLTKYLILMHPFNNSGGKECQNLCCFHHFKVKIFLLDCSSAAS